MQNSTQSIPKRETLKDISPGQDLKSKEIATIYRLTHARIRYAHLKVDINSARNVGCCKEEIKNQTRW